MIHYIGPEDFIYYSPEEFTAKILEKASHIAEFYSDEQYKYWKSNGYILPFQPSREHLSSGDKLILKSLIEQHTNGIPELYRRPFSVFKFALRVLYENWYPDYCGIRKRLIERVSD